MPLVGSYSRWELVFVTLFGISLSLGNAPALFWLSFSPLLFMQVFHFRNFKFQTYFIWMLLPYSFLAVLSLFWTPEWNATLTALKREVLIPLTIFLVFYSSYKKNWFHYLAYGSAIGVLFLTTLSVNLYFFHDPIFKRVEHYLPGVGDLSTYIVLIIPLFFMMGSIVKTRFRISVVFMGAGIALFAGYMTLNRMLWPTLALETFSYLALTLWFSSNAKIRKFKRVTILLSMVVLVLLVSFSAVTLKNKVKSGESSIGHVDTVIDHDPRWKIWNYWVLMIEKKPFLGYGYGKAIALRHSSIPIKDEDRAIIKLGIHGHNIFLNELSQLGIVGLMLFLLMLFLLGKQYWRALDYQQGKIYGIVGLTLMMGYLSKNMTDDFYTRQNLYFFWAMNGCLLRAAYNVSIVKNTDSELTI